MLRNLCTSKVFVNVNTFRFHYIFFLYPFLTTIISFPQSNYDGVVDAFDDMSLREDLLRGIYAYGFEKPSAIQQRAILPCIDGKFSYVLTV